jgi:hypothetical protein
MYVYVYVCTVWHSARVCCHRITSSSPGIPVNTSCPGPVRPPLVTCYYKRQTNISSLVNRVRCESVTICEVSVNVSRHAVQYWVTWGTGTPRDRDEVNSQARLLSRRPNLSDLSFLLESERSSHLNRMCHYIVSLFDPPGGLAFSYLVIIKSMTHTHSKYWTYIFRWYSRTFFHASTL